MMSYSDEWEKSFIKGQIQAEETWGKKKATLNPQVSG